VGLAAATNAATQQAKAVEVLESGQHRKRQADATRERVKIQIADWSTNWKAALREAGLKDSLSIDAATTILDFMTALDGLKIQIDDLGQSSLAVSPSRQACTQGRDSMLTALQRTEKRSGQSANCLSCCTSSQHLAHAIPSIQNGDGPSIYGKLRLRYRIANTGLEARDIPGQAHNANLSIY
jgi:uncharacterized protein YhaN